MPDDVSNGVFLASDDLHICICFYTTATEFRNISDSNILRGSMNPVVTTVGNLAEPPFRNFKTLVNK